MATNSVHMETQAVIPMVSTEVSTLPREQPVTRNIAIPLSPCPSCFNWLQEQSNSQCKIKCSCKSIQTPKLSDHTLKIRKSAQTCISSVDLLQSNNNTIKNGRRSKSQEELRKNDDIKEELLQLIKGLRSYTDFNVEVGVRNALLRRLRTKREERNYEPKVEYNRNKPSCKLGINSQNIAVEEKLRDIKIKTQRFGKKLQEVKSTRSLNEENETSFNSFKENHIDVLIKEWLKSIPLQSGDPLGQSEHIMNSLANKIKALIKDKVQTDNFASIKSEIYGLIEEASINTSVKNKNHLVNGLVNDLFKNIDNICVIDSTYRQKEKKTTDLVKTFKHDIQPEVISDIYVQPTENELKSFVKQEINDFATKFNLKICPLTREDIQIELTDLLIDSIEAIRYGNDERVKKEMLVTIYDFLDLSQHEAIYFVNNVIYSIKGMFKESRPENTMPQTFVVLQNTEQDFQTVNKPDSSSTEAVTDQDIQNNLELYTKQIVNQIKDWMSGVPELNNVETSFKQVVANDLAADVIDRHKYLEFNPNSRGIDAEELEHLKYQIFKWINKLVGEDNLGVIEQASELRTRIQSIPVPVLTRVSLNVKKRQPSCCRRNMQYQKSNSEKQQEPKPRKSSADDSKPINKCCAEYMARKNGSPASNRAAYTETDNMYQAPKTQRQGTSMSMIEVPKESRESRRHSTPAGYPNYPRTSQVPLAECGGNTSAKSCRYLNEQGNNTDAKAIPSHKSLNEEYDAYLKNWVKMIPIDVEPSIVDTVRLGIYKGIWNAITKLCMDPAIQANPFYFQDLLDDEVEDLLCCLPETPDLISKKYDLKSQLLAKTSEWNQQVLNVNAPSSYKQTLIDSISHVIPKQCMDYLGQDTVKIGAEICKINLAEDFILYSMYKENDQVKANVYKKKLMKHIQDFIDNLRRTQGRELKDVLQDIPQFREELMNSLYKVPLPSDDTIRDEGDEILLGFEIEQWFSDLPLHPIENDGEDVGRKRHKDNLASKIHEMRKHSDLVNCEDQLRYEIMKFLKRVPLREDETQNMRFMVDELVNRLKNKQKDVVSGSGARRSVNFVDPRDYDEFSRDMQICSSFTQTPEAKAQINQSSYMIFDGTRVKDKDYVPYRNGFKPNIPEIPESQIEWVSLLECSKVPPPPPYARPSPGVQGSPQASGNKSHSHDSRGFTSRLDEFRDDTLRSQPVTNGFTSNRANNIRQDQLPHPSRLPDSYVSIPYPGQGSTSQRITPTEVSGRIPDSSGFQGSPTGYPMPKNFGGSKNHSLRRSLNQTDRHIRDQSPYTARRQPQSFPGLNILDDYAHDGAPSSVDNFPHASFPTSAKSNQQPIRTSFNLNRESPIGRRSHIFYGHENPPPQVINSSRADEAEQGSRYVSQGSPGQGMDPLNDDEFYSQDEDISQTPMGFSTPQNYLPPPRLSRPKKRTRRHIDKTKRDSARRRLDLNDSDEGGREEEICRCMERIWRGRTGRNKPTYCPCEEFDMNMPPCFPMRYPYPYYFQNW